jgi:hypothetical protein
VADELPLAAASVRLSRKPGWPRKASSASAMRAAPSGTQRGLIDRVSATAAADRALPRSGWVPIESAVLAA